MPLNDLFIYELLNSGKNYIEARVSINFEHPVFQGHFPGNPVLPGVTQVELVRRIVSITTQRELKLVSAREIKYRAPIIPQNADNIIFKAELDYTGKEIKLKGSFLKGDVIFTKIKGVFSD